ncbi:SDR family oxidoreductase [Aquipuribacter nitratireducens]|uniref:SDR family oxidoreductase n=1 Tax=Aquipuribacter nitratireducens TaxID=650104 RepID=A0ABW0GPZ2_9MICO
MTQLRIGVTGATGRVGGRVARSLVSAGRDVRLLVRDASRVPGLEGPGRVDVAVCEYRDGGASRRALDGLDVVLMVSGAEAEDRVDEHRTFVDAAAAAGVGHLVYTSFAGASATSTFTLGRDHWATEQHVRASGVAHHTFLRDNLYADFVPFLAGEDGVIRGPAGEGRMAGVAIADVADVATAVLLDPDAHRDATYVLTGPEAFTLAEAAAVASRVTGRTLRYEPETLEEAYASRARYGAPDWQVEAWVSTYTAIAAGEMARVSDDVARVTGRPARSLEDVLTPAG